MKKSTNLIIPMAGQGKRFREAGCKIFKPFIPVMGKPMVQHVMDAFPDSVRKFVILSRSMLSSDEESYLANNLKCSIIDIPLHEDGPAFSVYQARNKLPLDEACFMSYCDIYWKWNYDEIATGLDCDGVVYTHSGFHPHLVGNNRYAFCLPEKEDPSLLKEIREKESYTDDWMSEPVSAGVFYVGSGSDMIDGISEMIAANMRVSGEFFLSLIFNYLAERKRDIRLSKLDFFIHWGVPEHLEDFQRWNAIIKDAEDPRMIDNPDCPENIITMAGLGMRMKELSDVPKALIPLAGRPMFEHVLARFPSRSVTLIISREMTEIPLNAGSQLVVLEHQTQSQYETLLCVRDLLISRADFFLTSCDAYGLFDYHSFRRFKDLRKPDAVIFTFKPSLIQLKNGRHHSHVSVSGERVTAVHIKSRSGPDDVGLAGFFWVREGKIFDRLKSLPATVNGEMYADHAFKFFVEMGLDIVRFDVDEYIHLGTPEEFLEFKYWCERESVFEM